MRSHSLDGREIAIFYNEAEAYTHEKRVIAELTPAMNKCPGGNGSRATPKLAYRKTKEDKEMDRLGTRKYSAILLLNKYIAFKCLESKIVYPNDVVECFDNMPVKRLLEVANGPRC